MLEALLGRPRIVDNKPGDWVMKTSSPGPRYYSMSGVIDDKIYTCSGHSGQGYLSDFWCYDTAADTWAQKQYGSGARVQGFSGAMGGKLYIGGGRTSTSIYPRDNIAYDPATNTWATRAAPSVDFYGAASAVIGDQLYLSQSGAGFSLVLWCYYGIGGNVWIQLAATPCSLRSGYSLVASGTKIYLYGGLQSVGGITNEHWVYDVPTNNWTQLPDGPGARCDHKAVAIGTKIYVYGGQKPVSGVMGEIWCYDTVTGKWEELKSGPMRYAHGLYLVDGKIYTHGGVDNTSAPVSAVWVFTPPA